MEIICKRCLVPVFFTDFGVTLKALEVIPSCRYDVLALILKPLLLKKVNVANYYSNRRPINISKDRNLESKLF